MGTIKTTNIEPIADNGTVTLGSSGDTFALGSGVKQSNMMYPSFRAYMNASQTVNDVTNTVIAYNIENFDTDSAYDTATYRFTVPSNKAGKYFFNAFAYFVDQSNTLYSAAIRIRKNGTTIATDAWSLDAADNMSTIINISTIVDLAVGDYVDVNCLGNTNDGGSFLLFTTSPYEFSAFQGFRIGS